MNSTVTQVMDTALRLSQSQTKASHSRPLQAIQTAQFLQIIKSLMLISQLTPQAWSGIMV